jgi:hypothetical protein
MGTCQLPPQVLVFAKCQLLIFPTMALAAALVASLVSAQVVALA